MGAMQSRPPLPTQASLFDAPPGSDTAPDGLSPALDAPDPAVEADPPPSLPLPGFLAAEGPTTDDAPAAGHGRRRPAGTGGRSGTPQRARRLLPPADAAICEAGAAGAVKGQSR